MVSEDTSLPHTVNYITNAVMNTVVGLIVNIALFWIVNRFVFSEEDRIPTKRLVALAAWTFIFGSLIWLMYRRYIVGAKDGSYNPIPIV